MPIWLVDPWCQQNFADIPVPVGGPASASINYFDILNEECLFHVFAAASSIGCGQSVGRLAMCCRSFYKLLWMAMDGDSSIYLKLF